MGTQKPEHVYQLKLLGQNLYNHRLYAVLLK